MSLESAAVDDPAARLVLLDYWAGLGLVDEETGLPPGWIWVDGIPVFAGFAEANSGTGMGTETWMGTWVGTETRTRTWTGTWVGTGTESGDDDGDGGVK